VESEHKECVLERRRAKKAHHWSCQKGPKDPLDQGPRGPKGPMGPNWEGGHAQTRFHSTVKQTPNCQADTQLLGRYQTVRQTTQLPGRHPTTWQTPNSRQCRYATMPQMCNNATICYNAPICHNASWGPRGLGGALGLPTHLTHTHTHTH
jgi:hypothetical protein